MVGLHFFPQFPTLQFPAVERQVWRSLESRPSWFLPHTCQQCITLGLRALGQPCEAGTPLPPGHDEETDAQ